MTSESDTKVTLLQKKLFFSSIRDGLRELFKAFLLLLCVIMFINMYTEIVIALIIIIFALRWPKILNRIKTKSIYPRVGYIDFLPNHKSKMRLYQRVQFGIIIVSLITFFIILIQQEWSIENTFKYLPILIGGIIFAHSCINYIMTARPLLTLIGMSCWIIAFSLYLFSLSEGRFYPMLYCAITSLIYFAIGGLKFKHFINNNPILPDQ